MSNIGLKEENYDECEKAIQRAIQEYPDYKAAMKNSIESQRRTEMWKAVYRCTLVFAAVLLGYLILIMTGIIPDVKEFEETFVYWLKMAVIAFSLVFGSYCPALTF